MPVIGIGQHPSWVNQDSRPFLKYFLPKGQPVNRMTLTRVARHFHLAFKGMEVDEIYDVLMEQLVAAINGYDPLYKAKVKQVVETIDREVPQCKRRFSTAEIQHYVEFDCRKHLRWMCRRGFLAVVPGGEEGEGSGFRRMEWPPTAELLEGDGSVIGLAYYLQKWFRFHLQDGITRHSRELESKEGDRPATKH